jgi:hypothetical protein
MLTLEVVYTDPDLIECVVSASSKSFAAATSIYFTCDALAEFASGIAGFPLQPGDHREFDAETLGSTFRLELDTAEPAGRCIAAVQIADAREVHQSAVVRFSVYAGDIDSFVTDLRRMSESEEGIATLGARATSAV